MKKFLLPLLTCLASCAFAQRSFFGVDAGINVANQRSRTVTPAFTPTSTITLNLFFQNTIKPTFGFFYQAGVSETVALRVQAQYMGMGYQDALYSSNNVDINYLTFPVSIQYSANKHLSFGAGPYLSFTLGGTKINNEDITKTYHKNDFGFFIGGEHDLYKNFALGVKYFIGTKNIWLNDQNGTIKYTNRALQFTLIYKFKKTN